MKQEAGNFGVPHLSIKGHEYLHTSPTGTATLACSDRVEFVMARDSADDPCADLVGAGVTEFQTLPTLPPPTHYQSMALKIIRASA